MKLYEITKKRDRDQYVIYSEIGGYVQGLLYNEEDITEERYLRFVEHYYGENLQHVVIERKLSDPNREYTEDEISEINSYISGTNSNTILKKSLEKPNLPETMQKKYCIRSMKIDLKSSGKPIVIKRVCTENMQI